jgi:hypothetical protein
MVLLPHRYWKIQHFVKNSVMPTRAKLSLASKTL